LPPAIQAAAQHASSRSSPIKKIRQPSFLVNFQARFRSTVKSDSKNDQITNTASVEDASVTVNAPRLSSPPLSSPLGIHIQAKQDNAIGYFDFEKQNEAVSTLELGPALLSHLPSSMEQSISNGSLKEVNTVLEEGIDTRSQLPEASHTDGILSTLDKGPVEGVGPHADLSNMDRPPTAIGMTVSLKAQDPGRHEVVTSLSSYLSHLANNFQVRQTHAWKVFTRIHRKDLASANKAERTGEEWVEIEKLSEESELFRRSSIDKSARRKSALRKSKSLTGGILLGQSWRKGSDTNEEGWQSAATSVEPLEGASDQEHQPAAPLEEKNVDTHVDQPPKLPSAGDDSPRQLAQVDSGIVFEKRPSKASGNQQFKATQAADASPSETTATSAHDTSTELRSEDAVTDVVQEEQPAHQRQKKGRSTSQVKVDDFELIRVLGKGCAGKVGGVGMSWGPRCRFIP
jgi:hypothetical protein